MQHIHITLLREPLMSIAFSSTMQENQPWSSLTLCIPWCILDTEGYHTPIDHKLFVGVAFNMQLSARSQNNSLWYSLNQVETSFLTILLMARLWKYGISYTLAHGKIYVWLRVTRQIYQYPSYTGIIKCLQEGVPILISGEHSIIA